MTCRDFLRSASRSFNISTSVYRVLNKNYKSTVIITWCNLRSSRLLGATILTLASRIQGKKSFPNHHHRITTSAASTDRARTGQLVSRRILHSSSGKSNVRRRRWISRRHTRLGALPRRGMRCRGKRRRRKGGRYQKIREPITDAMQMERSLRRPFLSLLLPVGAVSRSFRRCCSSLKRFKARCRYGTPCGVRTNPMLALVASQSETEAPRDRPPV